MIVKKLSLSIFIALAAGGVQAGNGAPLFSVQRSVLPDIAAPSDLPVSRFAANGQSITAGGDTRDQTWTTSMSYPSRLDAAMNLDYGLQFDSNFAGGANLTYGARHKELLLNAIYAPQKDLRFQLSGGQLHQTDDFQFASGLHTDSVAQQNYLLGVRKYWDQSAFFSDVSLTAWHSHADDPSIGQKTMMQETDQATQVYIDPRTLATGALHGYLLNLSVTPLPQSRLELGAGMDRVAYDFADGSAEHDSTASRRLHYTQYLGNCSRLQGSYQRNASWRSFGVSVARGAWTIGASRSLDHDSGDSSYTLNAGYTIPLGTASARANTCGSELKQAGTFGTMAGGSVTRNPNLPAAPLVQVDSTVSPILSAAAAKDR